MSHTQGDLFDSRITRFEGLKEEQKVKPRYFSNAHSIGCFEGQLLDAAAFITGDGMQGAGPRRGKEQENFDSSLLKK